jgi:DNA-binding transcriptional regulator YhcF (GntR family)
VPFSIDTHAPEPAWQQLAAQLRSHVAALKPRDPVPSIHVLADETGLALGTVQKALAALKAEGLIYSVSGRGTFKRLPRGTVNLPVSGVHRRHPTRLCA